MNMEDLLAHGGAGWMEGSGEDSDVVLSSRIRLARNLRQIPFPNAASGEQLEHVLQVCGNLLESARGLGDLTLFRMNQLEPLDRQLLVERHLVSPQQATDVEHKGVIIQSDETVSIMINEEDHLRIQAFQPGLALNKALELGNRFDDYLDAGLQYAFDDARGYLTACPTNLGTGLRASVMVHLPALSLAQQIRRLSVGLGQIGLVVRGLYGEGSEMVGNIYQISNQITLGPREQDIISHLTDVTHQVILQERGARQALVDQNRLALEDRVWRALGTLRYARQLSTQDALTFLSDVRLGIDLGLITGIQPIVLQELLVQIRPAHLQRLMGREMDASARDVARAAWIRRRIAEALGEKD